MPRTNVARKKRAEKIANGYLHPYAEAHRPGTRWPPDVIARVVSFAVLHSPISAARRYPGIPPETIAQWVIDAAKPSPESTAADRTRVQLIRHTCEKVIYLQAKRILRRLEKKLDAGEPILDQDRAWVAERLAKTLAMLGATAQRWDMADVTADVRESRRLEDEELRKFEAEQRKAAAGNNSEEEGG